MYCYIIIIVLCIILKHKLKQQTYNIKKEQKKQLQAQNLNPWNCKVFQSSETQEATHATKQNPKNSVGCNPPRKLIICLESNRISCKFSVAWNHGNSWMIPNQICDIDKVSSGRNLAMPPLGCIGRKCPSAHQPCLCVKHCTNIIPAREFNGSCISHMLLFYLQYNI